MVVRRHRDDTATYRELTSYSQRVKSFNAIVQKLHVRPCAIGIGCIWSSICEQYRCCTRKDSSESDRQAQSHGVSPDERTVKRL
jgi:hypothetical protein